jgi:hypothetical protein
MHVLFVAPLPPPVSGNSLPIVALRDHLLKAHAVDVIDVNRSDHGSGGLTISRMCEIVKVARAIHQQHQKSDLVYLTLAESTLGNVRDLLFLFLLRRRLETVVVHMFGGASMEDDAIEVTILWPGGRRGRYSKTIVPKSNVNREDRRSK